MAETDNKTQYRLIATRRANESYTSYSVERREGKSGKWQHVDGSVVIDDYLKAEEAYNFIVANGGFGKTVVVVKESNL